MFVWSNKELNIEQSEAVLSPENVLLVACPGSGKTRALIYKAAYELSKISSTKKKILAITYTNNAADEIRERIENMGVETEQLWIGTIHSFCLQWILRPYSNLIEDLKYGFGIIDAYDAECSKDYFLYDQNHKLNKYNSSCYYDVDGLKVRSSNIHSATIAFNKYFELLKINKQIDFDLILYYSYKLLKIKPYIGKLLSQIFPYILIDEYQDTTNLQYNIMSKIVNQEQQKSQMFIVGDPNQSIFKSLGGFSMPQKELEKLTNLKFTEKQLSKNYRSSEKIVNYYDKFKVYGNNIEAVCLFKDFSSQIYENNSILHEDKSLFQEIKEIVKLNIENYNIPENKICILAPHWNMVSPIVRYLSEQLPEYRFNGPGLVPFCHDRENIWFRLSKILLTQASPEIYLRRKRWANEFIEALELAEVNCENIDASKVLCTCNGLEVCENDGLEYLKISFIKFLDKLKIKIEIYPMLKAHYQAFFKISKDKIDKWNSDGLEYISTVEHFRKVFKEKEGITITIIHKVKGLEFDTVIAFGLLDGILPHYSIPEVEKGNEQKRFLFVISSRARKHLFLFSEKRKDNYTKKYRHPTPELNTYKYSYNNEIIE